MMSTNYTAHHPDGTVTHHASRREAIQACWANGGKVRRDGKFVIALAARA